MKKHKKHLISKYSFNEHQIWFDTNLRYSCKKKNTTKNIKNIKFPSIVSTTVKFDLWPHLPYSCKKNIEKTSKDIKFPSIVSTIVKF